MDGLTPAFWLQVIATVGAVAVGFGVLNANVKNLGRSLDLEREARKDHAKEDDVSFHDIRNELQSQHGRLARIEGQHDLGDKIVAAMSRH
ncbi:MAG TPA: hypothetical protein VF516_03170 [Kofleriaceae bacterium]